MRALADAARYFAPELEVLDVPGLGLPALRPQLAVAARDRRAAGHAPRAAAQGRTGRSCSSPPSTPRPSATLTPFRIRQLVARLAPGERIDLDRLTALLQANGYGRTETVPTPASSRCAAASSTSFPPARSMALRLDFFGDEIESVRRFDPADPAHASTGSTASPCCPRPRRCSTRTASSASAGAIARSSAPPRPAIRSTRRSARPPPRRHGALAAACSRSGWRPCSTISATTI